MSRKDSSYGEPPEGMEVLDITRLVPGCLTIAKQNGFILLITKIKHRENDSMDRPYWVEVECVTLDSRIIDSCTLWTTTSVWVVYPEGSHGKVG